TEDGGLEEVAARQILRAAAAGCEDRAFTLPGFYVLLDLGAPLLANDWSEEDARVGRIADLHHPAHEVDHLLHHGVVRLARDQHAGRHGAPLTGVEEGGPRGLR